MRTKAISESRLLIAQSRRTRASANQLVETSQRIIRDSPLLIQRATQTCNSTMMGSAAEPAALNQALVQVLACRDAGKMREARQWAAELIRLLKSHGVLA